MHLLAWLDALGATDSVSDASRRRALAQLGRGALAAAPALLTTALSATAGPPRVTSVTTDALNKLVLRFAYAQRELLRQALATTGLVPAADQPRLQVVHDQMADLITLVAEAVQRSGDIVEPMPGAYDFTGNASAGGGGPLNPLGDYPQLLLLSQVFADELSRGLISSLGILAANTVFAELAGQLLGTTSRLAADLRLLRRAQGVPVLPWLVEAEAGTGLPSLFTTTTVPYAGEDSVVVFSPALDLASTGTYAVLPDDPARTHADLTAAFDRPIVAPRGQDLPEAAFAALLAPFIVV